MEQLFNIKTNWKHGVLEHAIKKIDPEQDLCRSAIFSRMIDAAQDVENWKEIQAMLVDIKKEEGAPVFTSYQVRYDENTANRLEKVKKQILEQIESIKVLQAQYLLQLLQVNYLNKLKKALVRIKIADYIDEDAVDLPRISSLLTQMMLTDKDCTELKQIRRILIDWGNKNYEPDR